MKLLTIIFIITSIITLFKGNIFQKIFISCLKDILKIAEDNPTYDKEELKSKLATAESSIKMLLTFAFMTIAFLIELIFTIKCTSIDIYTYPSLLFLGLTIFQIISSFIKKKSSNNGDLSTVEGRYEAKKGIEKLEKFSLRVKIIQLIDVLFWGYMFWILFLLK